MHKLVAPSLLDPRWFNLMRSNQWTTAKVLTPDSIEVEGEVLYLANPHEIILKPSHIAYVFLTSHFYIQTEEERQSLQKEIAERKVREDREYREQLNQWRDEAIAFNATLHIPIMWVPGIKDVLSGLSENSMGNGHNAATVEHIMLKEDLHDGRLHRSRGDFLCTSTSGSNGKCWTAQPESLALDGDGKKYRPKVTCKSCLKIAQRWINSK